MKKKPLLFISPLLLAGILLILLPIFTIMTLERLERQKEFFAQRLLEKGVSLIRTFEAGTRTGMFTMRWGAQRIQAMLLETSFQPEVVYMAIASRDGRILAHSDASMVGQILNNMPEVEKTDQDPGLVLHRVKRQKDTVDVFEVYKRFVPIRKKFMRRHMGKHGFVHDKRKDLPFQHELNNEHKDWSLPYITARGDTLPEMAEHYIFAGLSMDRVRIARAILLKQTVRRGVFFFIVGCAGMVALFAFQAYRSAKASLTRVKAFSDKVIQDMPSGLVTLNTTHEITSMNKAARDIFRQDLRKPFPRMIELIREMEVSQGNINREISLTVTPSHKVRLDITASSIKDSEKKTMGYLFLFKDLTQIKELKKQVETNKRLAAIGKLAAGVAHEIRNPLSSIKGFATYFSKRYDENADDKETAQIMVSEVERINRSITQLLEFAKPMAVEKKHVDIKKMISHSLKLVHRDLAQEKIETTVNIRTDKTGLYTDGDRMNQVLLNLYINAIEALSNGGRLEIEVKDSKGKDAVEIQVKDNGIGIDADEKDLIFDPYFTTRPTGTGLGLSIVHRIIENLGGQIHVESSRGRGTCFTIILPVS